MPAVVLIFRLFTCTVTQPMSVQGQEKSKGLIFRMSCAVPVNRGGKLEVGSH